jgi:hypothetical protein
MTRWPDHTLQPTRDGVASSAVAVHVSRRLWLKLVRWEIMRKTIYISTSLAVALLASGCHSPSPTTEAPVAPVVSQAPAPKPFISHHIHPVPSDLPTFGTPTTNSIRVAIFGMSETVMQPGHYYLAQGAVVRDAVEAAHGIGNQAEWTWSHYSGIERPKPDGSFEVIRFTQGRSAGEQILLQDGDRIYFGHEVY